MGILTYLYEARPIEISEQLDVPVKETKSQWTSLHAQFGREIKNVRNPKGGHSTDELLWYRGSSIDVEILQQF